MFLDSLQSYRTELCGNLMGNHAVNNSVCQKRVRFQIPEVSVYPTHETILSLLAPCSDMSECRVLFYSYESIQIINGSLSHFVQK